MMKGIVVIGLTLMMTGCAKFSCGQFPQSGCQPVSHVYDRTNDGFNDYRTSLNKDDRKTRSKRHYHDHTFDDRLKVGAAHKAVNYANPGDPILTKPVIIRVLVAPWEDKQNDLNAGGYVYLKLRESEWVLTQ